MSDFKINPALCFNVDDLIRFMRQNTVDNTLSQEIAAALVYRLVLEKIYGWRDYAIYFEPQAGKNRELLEKIGSTITMPDLLTFISENAEQDTPYDVIFVRKRADCAADVRPIQIKRYGKGRKGELTESFTTYLEEKIIKHYSKNKATLLVHFESIGSIKPQQVIEWLSGHNFNFDELVMFTVQPDGSVTICQIYPNAGYPEVLTLMSSEVLGS